VTFTGLLRGTALAALVPLVHAGPAPAQTTVDAGLAASAACRRAAAVMVEGLSAENESVRLRAWELGAGLATPDLEETARKGAESPDRYERTLALEMLARVDVAGNRDLFLQALDSPFRSVRVRAVLALATLDTPEVAARLARVLAEDPDLDVRALAAAGLARSAGPEARAALRQAVADPRPVLQEAAVRALVAAGDSEVGADLLRRVAGATDADACRLLDLAGLVPDPGLAPALARLLDHPSPKVRLSAAAALLHLAERAR
jgi:HEAT repeat protein